MLVEHIDGEAVVLDPNEDTYFTVNEVGALVLKSITENCDVDAMIKNITDEFDVDETTAKLDATAFLESMIDASLISPSE